MNFNHILSVSLITLIASSSFAAPGIGRPRVGSGINPRSSEKSLEKGKESSKKEETTLERWQRFESETTTLAKLQLSRDQMKALVREFRGNPSEYASFQRLIRSTPTVKTAQDGLLLKGYFQFLASTNGEFHLLPSILEERMNTWSPITKEHLGTVLETSAEFAKQGKAVIREEAFELALKKFGIDTEYQKKCRRG